MDTIHFKSKLITSFSVILGSIIVATVALYILVGKIDTATTAIAQSEASIGQQVGSLSVIAELKQQASQATTYQTAMNQLLPTQDGLIGFSQWISGIANQYQVAASVTFQNNAGSAPAPAGSAPSLGQMAFSLSASGSSNSLAAFLNDVESKASGFLVSIPSFNLTNASGSYQLAAQGDVFFQQ